MFTSDLGDSVEQVPTAVGVVDVLFTKTCPAGSILVRECSFAVGHRYVVTNPGLMDVKDWRAMVANAVKPLGQVKPFVVAA